MDLSLAAKRLLNTPNAGGNSIESEVLGFELLHRCFGASLLNTEMEIQYFPEGGSITDYSCSVFGTILGVSVTRAFKYRGIFTEEDGERLLTKKLKGIVNATRNTLEKWHKQILHVWVPTRRTAYILDDVYQRLSKEITSDTVVVITVVESASTLSYNTK